MPPGYNQQQAYSSRGPVQQTHHQSLNRGATSAVDSGSETDASSVSSRKDSKRSSGMLKGLFRKKSTQLWEKPSFFVCLREWFFGSKVFIYELNWVELSFFFLFDGGEKQFFFAQKWRTTSSISHMALRKWFPVKSSSFQSIFFTNLPKEWFIFFLSVLRQRLWYTWRISREHSLYLLIFAGGRKNNRAHLLYRCSRNVFKRGTVPLLLAGTVPVEKE